MTVWAFVLIVVLLIPLLAIVIDSQVGQALAERISGGGEAGEDGEVRPRLEALEAEVRYLSESVESLREETHFLRSLLEPPREAGDAPEVPRRSDPADPD